MTNNTIDPLPQQHNKFLFKIFLEQTDPCWHIKHSDSRFFVCFFFFYLFILSQMFSWVCKRSKSVVFPFVFIRFFSVCNDKKKGIRKMNNGNMYCCRESSAAHNQKEREATDRPHLQWIKRKGKARAKM